MDYEDDDLDVEIIDIDETDGETSKKSAHFPPRSPLASRFSPQQRRVQLIATTSIIGLLLLVILGSYAPVRSIIVKSIIPPAPSPTQSMAPGLNRFYFSANPLWGHLFIDGRVIPHPPQAYQPGTTPLELSRGRHTIRWMADPFTPQQCALSVPPNYEKDTCPFNQFIQPPQGVGGWLVNFSVSLAQLAEPFRSTLISKVQSALDTESSTETVLPGEFYAIDFPGHQNTAHELLKARLHYELDTQNTLDVGCSSLFESPGDCVFQGQECHLFCTAQLVSPIATQEWQILAVVRATWDYATTDGKIVARKQPETADPAVASEHLVPLRVEWNGAQWHITSTYSLLKREMKQQFDPVCSVAANEVRIDISRSYVVEAHLGTNWEYVSGTNLASGCLSRVTLDYGAAATPSPGQPVAYCLYHFGLFIATNDVAHKYWPDMPVADAYERHLAQQLASSYKGTQTEMGARSGQVLAAYSSQQCRNKNGYDSGYTERQTHLCAMRG